ncbi:MAG: hypothetical protein KGL52_18100 [Rhodospirillales bacterium]|nr:hypothetical protein [Rhodospirillales bacterium]
MRRTLIIARPVLLAPGPAWSWLQRLVLGPPGPGHLPGDRRLRRLGSSVPASSGSCRLVPVVPSAALGLLVRLVRR